MDHNTFVKIYKSGLGLKEDEVLPDKSEENKDYWNSL